MSTPVPSEEIEDIVRDNEQANSQDQPTNNQNGENGNSRNHEKEGESHDERHTTGPETEDKGDVKEAHVEGSEEKTGGGEGAGGEVEVAAAQVSEGEGITEFSETETKTSQEDVKVGDSTPTKPISVSTSANFPVESQEAMIVSSTTSARRESKIRSGPRRPSFHQSSRGYAGNFQNYGLTYLPYKSNFEPSEQARRRADEFIKTLRL